MPKRIGRVGVYLTDGVRIWKVESYFFVGRRLWYQLVWLHRSVFHISALALEKRIAHGKWKVKRKSNSQSKSHKQRGRARQ